MKRILTKDLICFSDKNLVPTISNKRRVLEISAVLLTAIGKFIFMDYLNYRLFYVVFAISFWLIYIKIRCRYEKNILRYWGFRSDNFIYTFKIMLPFGVISGIIFLLIGSFQNTINLSWHILPLLITYPLWGTIQQFLSITLIAGNLNDLKNFKLNRTLIIIFTALLFSFVHYPSLWLMAGTFLLALYYGFIYIKVKNVFAMGIFHGWLGALFYFTVLGQDPFQDVFLKLLQH